MRSPSLPRRHYGGSRAAVLFVLLAIVGGGILAYRHFFHRSGEAAIQLIPADAMGVVTLDTTPSPEQVPLFTRLSRTLQQEKIDTQLDQMMTSSFQNTKIYRDMRPLLSNSFALAVLKPEKPAKPDDVDLVFLVAVKNPAQAIDVLARYGQKGQQDSLEYYRLPKEETTAAVLAGYLVISDKVGPLARIMSVYRGETASVATLDEYKQARAALPADANLMVFVSPKGLTAISQASGQNKAMQISPLKNTRWLAASVTARDQGLDTMLQMPMGAAGMNNANLPQTAPLSAGLSARLPSGAFGLIAYSQLGKYWDTITTSAGSDPSTKKSFDDGMQAFEKETGMSVPNDVVPGLNGNIVLAVYPDANDGKTGVDGLILIDDANGADPAALADKIRAYVERASAHDGKPGVHFLSTQRDGVTYWALDSASQDQIRHQASDLAGSSNSFFGGSSGPSGPPPSFNSSGSPNGVDIHANGADVHVDDNSFHAQGGGTSVDVGQHGLSAQGGGASLTIGSPPAPPASKLDPRIADKALVFAQVGKTFLLASSQKMLDRAVAAYQHGTDMLAADPSYVQTQRMVPPGTQSLMLIDLPRIMQTLRPFLADTMKGNPSGITADDVVQMFGTASLLSTYRYDGKIGTATFFLPLNYERVIHMIHVSSQNSGASSSSGPPGSPGTMGDFTRGSTSSGTTGDSGSSDSGGTAAPNPPDNTFH